MTKGKFVDLTGRKFGRWTVVEYRGKSRWYCKCQCGTEREVLSKSLIEGRSTSCGCHHKTIIAAKLTRHGGSDSRLYNVWAHMKGRCQNPNDPKYSYYGGIGVAVCDEWQSFEPFSVWAYNNGYLPDAPRGTCTLDRIDCFGDYTPQNCRWVNMSVQNSNRRPYRRPKLFKAVEQLDMDGNVIATFPSIRDASSATGIDSSSITAVCNGRLKTIHGTIWRHAKSSHDESGKTNNNEEPEQ